MVDVVNIVLTNFLRSVGSFLPNLFAGILMLLIGLLIGSIAKHVIITVYSFFKIDSFLQKTKILGKNQLKVWVEVLTEVLKWMLIIVFLVPALEIWGLSKATEILNQILLFLPNVVIAVVIAFVGLVAANLSSDVVSHSVKTIGATSANSLAVFTKWVISFFTILVVLNQLGVAQDLVRILFTGIVAMISLAGGLAFGLGGQQVAKEILEDLKKKLEG